MCATSATNVVQNVVQFYLYFKYKSVYVHENSENWAHKFFDSLCIMHLMSVYIHENSEIKFLLFWTLTFDDL